VVILVWLVAECGCCLLIHECLNRVTLAAAGFCRTFNMSAHNWVPNNLQVVELNTNALAEVRACVGLGDRSG